MEKKPEKTIDILVRNGIDPIRVALMHTKCPLCKLELDNEWRCKKCKIRLLFKQEDIK